MPLAMPRNSDTRYNIARISPCLCASSADDDAVHGFTMAAGVRNGMYLAARRDQGGVRWLDLAVSAGNGQGTIALRAWVDVETKVVKSRVLRPNEVEDHPALTLGGWLNRDEVHALGCDVAGITIQVVIGDDRLVAHLCDVPDPHAATSLARPVSRASA